MSRLAAALLAAALSFGPKTCDTTAKGPDAGGPGCPECPDNTCTCDAAHTDA